MQKSDKFREIFAAREREEHAAKSVKLATLARRYVENLHPEAKDWRLEDMRRFVFNNRAPGDVLFRAVVRYTRAMVTLGHASNVDVDMSVALRARAA